MLKMSAMPRPEAKKFKDRTFRSLASTTMSLMLGGPFWTVCVVCCVMSFICDHFDITSRTTLHCSADVLDIFNFKDSKL